MSPALGFDEGGDFPRVLVVGLDGATFDIIEPLLKDGELPNLGTLIDEGSSGILESTIPPVTIPAWVSMLTGKNPGKLGCFDLLKRVGYLSEPNSFCYEGNSPLWHILNKYGIKTGLMNIPGTFPPKKVKGFMITGMLTPSKRSEYSFPSQLADDLDSRINDYEIDVAQWQYLDEGHFVKDLYNVTNKRLEAALYLTEKIPCDFYMIVFTSSDRLHHVLWNKSEVIREYWKELDKVLGQLFDHFKDDTIIIVSDHGFGPLKKTFNVNEWLEEKNYLKLKESPERGFMSKFGGFIESIYRVLKKNFKSIDPLLGYLNELVGGDRLQKATYNYLSSEKLKKYVKWRDTKAFGAVHSPHFGQIYLNVKEKMENGVILPSEKKSIREEIIRDLKDLRDPNTGEHLKIDVYRPEEIYMGPDLDEAPDIIFMIEDGTIEIDATIGDGEFLQEGSPFTGWTGTHKRDGIFIAKGPWIKRGHKIGRSSIMDVTPTIMQLYGIPTPADIDGVPLKEIFTRDFNERELIDTSDEGDVHEGLTEEEKNLIEERLKKLGYIS